MTPRELWARVKGIMRRGDPDRDFEEEIAQHLELATAENLRQGLDPEEARRRAAVRFGSVASALEAVRDERGLPGLSSFLQDVRYALRGMRMNPGFTLVTVLTLMLGIGLSTLLFSLLNALALRPAPGISDAGRLVTLEAPVTYPTVEHYRNQPGPAAGMAAFIGPAPISIAVNASADGKAERIFGHLVTPEYFATLGVRPLLGRFFDPARELPGAAPTVVVSERFWRTNLHGDPRAAGMALRVNGRRATIIGVGPKDFLGVFPTTPADLFLPVTADPAVAPELADDVLHRATQPSFRVLFRLAPRMTMATTEARLDVVTREFDRQNARPGPERKGRQVHLMLAGQMLPMPPWFRSLVVTFYAFLVVLILSLTCSNLAGLILARAGARSREIAIRLSIGAGRFRLVRQLLTESLILAGFGGFGGLAAAYGFLGLQAMFFQGPAAAGMKLDTAPDLPVVLFVFLVSALAAAGFGLVPALAATRPDLTRALKASSGTPPSRYRRFGLRNLFVVYQVAAAMMLILIMQVWSSGLRGFSGLDPGFDPAPVQFFSLDPLRDGFTPERSADLLAGLPQRLMRLPGADQVTLAGEPPRSPAVANTPIAVPAVSAGGRESVHRAGLESIGPAYFATLGVPLVRGAEFTERDLSWDPAPADILPAVINQTAAREFFGDADPLGRRIRQNGDDVQRIFQVAGVAPYDRPYPMINRPAATIFLPLTRKDLRRGRQSGTIVVLRARTYLDGGAIRRALASIDPNLTVFNPQSMREFLSSQERAVIGGASFLTAIGLFGLLLASIGLAGVTAQAVERRRKELGIRMALGARPPQVLRLVMREGAAMIFSGAAIGFGGAMGLSRALAAFSSDMAQLIHASTGGRAVTVGIPLLLVSLAAIACYVPARRSTSLDPLAVLREE